MSDAPCWCGRDHRDTETDDWMLNFRNANTTLGHALLAMLRIPQMVDGLDRLLRRWPWLYRKLGGDL